MSSIAQQQAQIVVVDPFPSDYAELTAEAEAHGVAWKAYTCGSDLLRSGDLRDVLCWIVQIELPDLGGVELLRMLSKCQPTTPALLVSNEYSQRAEVEVLSSGLGQYACKPLPMEWFSKWATRPVENPRKRGRRLLAS